MLAGRYYQRAPLRAKMHELAKVSLRIKLAYDFTFMRTFASSMSGLGVCNLYAQGHPVLVLGIEHAQFIAEAGWKKHDAKMALFERARQPWRLVKDRGRAKFKHFPMWVDRNDDSSLVPVVSQPDDLIVIVGGGAGGKPMFLPTAGAQSLSVTKLVETEG